METMILGRVVAQAAVVREARVVAGTWESGIRTFLTQAWEGDDRRMGGEQRGHSGGNRLRYREPRPQRDRRPTTPS